MIGGGRTIPSLIPTQAMAALLPVGDTPKQPYQPASLVVAEPMVRLPWALTASLPSWPGSRGAAWPSRSHNWTRGELDCSRRHSSVNFAPCLIVLSSG